MHLRGSFLLQGSSAPTVLRDGTNVVSTGKWFTVSRTSAGLYLVTIATGFPIPKVPFIITEVSQSATPTNHAFSCKVVGTWSSTTRTFNILIRKTTDGSASDGDVNDRVTFNVMGSYVGPGIDPA